MAIDYNAQGVQVNVKIGRSNNLTLGNINTVLVIGTAKTSTTGPKVINNLQEGEAAFGKVTTAFAATPQKPAFTIPADISLRFYTQSVPTVYINVFDPLKHLTTVSAESSTVSDGVIYTANEIYGLTNVKKGDGSVTYVADVDYSYSEKTGIVVLDGSSIVDGSLVQVTYTYVDQTKVSTSIVDVINGLNASPTIADWVPNFVVAPCYSEIKAVRDAMNSLCSTPYAISKCICSIDPNLGYEQDAALLATVRNTTSLDVNGVSNKNIDLIYGSMTGVSSYTGQSYKLTPDVFISWSYSLMNSTQGLAVSAVNSFETSGSTISVLSAFPVDSSCIVPYSHNVAYRKTDLFAKIGVQCFAMVPSTGRVTVWGVYSSAHPLLTPDIENQSETRCARIAQVFIYQALNAAIKYYGKIMSDVTSQYLISDIENIATAINNTSSSSGRLIRLVKMELKNTAADIANQANGIFTYDVQIQITPSGRVIIFDLTIQPNEN